MPALFNALREHWNDFSWLIAVGIFVAYIILDILFVHYTLAVSRLEAVRASTTGAAMYFLLAIGIVNYAHNPLYILSVVAGSWFGTYISVERERRKKLETVKPQQ